MIVKLNDIFTFKNGLFSKLVTKYHGEYFFEIRAPTMDIDFLMQYGERSITKSLKKIYENVGLKYCNHYDPVFAENNMIHAQNETQEYIIDIIDMRYRDKWKRLYTALLSEYNPIDNYNMEENMTRNNDENGVNEKISDFTGNKTDIESQEKKDIINQNISNDLINNTTQNFTQDLNKQNSKSSYDSNTLQPYESIDDNTTSDTTNNTTAQENEESNTTNTSSNNINKQTGETNRIKENSSNQVNINESHKLTRKGNIGVTTTQEMIDSELKLREYDLFKTIYQDVLKLITLSIYEY